MTDVTQRHNVTENVSRSNSLFETDSMGSTSPTTVTTLSVTSTILNISNAKPSPAENESTSTSSASNSSFETGHSGLISTKPVTTSDSNIIFSRRSDDDNPSPSSLTVIIAVCVTVGVVSAVVIVIVCLIRYERNKSSSEQDSGHPNRFDNGAYDTTYAEIKDESTGDKLQHNTIVIDTGSSYADVDINEVSLGDEYNHIGSMPARPTARTGDAVRHKSYSLDDYSHISSSGNTFSATNDPSYSHIGRVARTTSNDAGDDTSRQDVDTTYDHLGAGQSMKRPRLSGDRDGTGTEMDCEYNLINTATMLAPPSPSFNVERETDTYNHISQITTMPGTTPTNVAFAPMSKKQSYTHATVCKPELKQMLSAGQGNNRFENEENATERHAYFVLEKQ